MRTEARKQDLKRAISVFLLMHRNPLHSISGGPDYRLMKIDGPRIDALSVEAVPLAQIDEMISNFVDKYVAGTEPAPEPHRFEPDAHFCCNMLCYAAKGAPSARLGCPAGDEPARAADTP